MMYLLAARAFLKRIPWQVYALIALLAVWYIDRTNYGNERAYQERVKMQAQIDRAEAERQAAVASETEALLKLSKDADRAVYQAREDNRSRVDAFIARGGVRPCTADHQAGVSGTGDSAGLRETPELDGTETLPEVVTVLPEDVRICTDNTLKAEEWRNLLLGMEGR